MRRALFAIALVACGGNAASKLATTPEMPLQAGQTRCSVKGSQNKPLIVEWSSDQRGDLEALVRSNKVVAVRYVGCEKDVLEQCSAPGAYKYVGYTPKQDHIAIKDEDDLYANMPLGAARLEAKLRAKKQLDVSMTLVGKYQADATSVSASDLRGRCDGATHVIVGLTTGAFEFSAGAEAEVGGGVGVVGAESRAQRELLRRDGEATACARAKTDDAAPPQGCGALLKIEVVALDAPASASAPSTASVPPPAPAPAPAPGRTPAHVKLPPKLGTGGEKLARTLLKQATEEDFLAVDFTAALQKLHRAVDSCVAQGCPTSLYVDLYVSLGAIAHMNKQIDDARDWFQRALEINKSVALPADFRTPETLAFFEGVRRDLESTKR
jgi:hypothetical protein